MSAPSSPSRWRGERAGRIVHWRIASGNPADNELVFPAPNGHHWQEHTYKNWRRRDFKPAAAAAGLGNIRFYDLRHALASLLFAEGRNPRGGDRRHGQRVASLVV
jgi:integrase